MFYVLCMYCVIYVHVSTPLSLDMSFFHDQSSMILFITVLSPIRVQYVCSVVVYVVYVVYVVQYV